MLISGRNIARWGMTGVLHRDDMYIFGGRGTDDRARNNMFCVELANHRFKQINQINAPKERDGHSCVVHNDSLVVFGGIQGSLGSYNVYNDTHVFDLATKTWRELETVGDVPAGREGHASWVIDDYMFIYGGS